MNLEILFLVVVGLVIVLGLVGAVVQLWPSAPLIGGAILVWAIVTGGVVAWSVFAVAAIVLVTAMIVKFVVPGRRLARSGIPNSTL
ncbi:MAG: hypothetical protein CSA82_02750, partial [Actinobacteria bacterium]